VNGQPRPPFEHAHAVYVLNLNTAERTTYVTSTTGGAIAVSHLKDKVAWMRRLRGANVVPRIELTCAPMNTRFGMRKRPDFRVTGWLDFGGGETLLPDTPKQVVPPAVPKKVEESTTAEDLDERLPW